MCVRGNTMFDIRKWAQQKSVDIVKVVDISTLSEIENRGFPRAILLVNILPKDLVNKIIREEEDKQQIFSDVEHQTDEIADQLAEAIHEAGYHAISQSEKGIGIRSEFNFETKTSILPHKKMAVLSGLGWIGKNNLLVTEEYGSALTMCSLLTDMQVEVDSAKMILPQCGNCNLCVKCCPANALHNQTWKPDGNRDEIVDVYQCKTCLKCLGKCRYSIAYARKDGEKNEYQ